MENKTEVIPSEQADCLLGSRHYQKTRRVTNINGTFEHKPTLNHELAPADAGCSMVGAHLENVNFDSLR